MSESPTCFRKILFHLQCLQIDRLCAYTCTCTTDILAGFISVWEGGGGAFARGWLALPEPEECVSCTCHPPFSPSPQTLPTREQNPEIEPVFV